jgi:hypothetical protein
VVSVINGVGKWLEQYAMEILVNKPVRFAVLLNMEQVGIEDRDKPISKSLVTFLVTTELLLLCLATPPGGDGFQSWAKRLHSLSKLLERKR